MQPHRDREKSVYINLMRIKQAYFDKIFKLVQDEIEEKSHELPELRRGLYDNLYTFFRTLFLLGFPTTTSKDTICEKHCLNTNDVTMFWTLRGFYYVKTVALGDGEKAQHEIDYFIPKQPYEFFHNQFNLWLYHQFFAKNTRLTEKKIKQLTVLRETASKIINFMVQFEDEILTIWKKPKFVLNSNYVITLDRIASKKGGILVIKKIIDRLKKQEEEFRQEIDKWRKIKAKHRIYRRRIEEAGNINNQVVEWYLLDIIDDNFDPNNILVKNTLLKYVPDQGEGTSSGGETLNPKYRFLPIDTKYFKDLEVEILELFDNLDQELDGWLIKSENWQALNTILSKFRGKVQTIYIDPPFNTGSNKSTLYMNKFRAGAWVTMMENRLSLAKEFLKKTGAIFVRIDYHGNHYVRFLMDEIFGKENFRNEIIIRRTKAKQKSTKRFIQQTESLFFYSRTSDFILNPIERPTTPKWYPLLHFPRGDCKPRVILGKVFYPPKGRRWALSQKRIDRLVKKSKIRINRDLTYMDCRGTLVKGVPEVLYDSEVVGNEWLDISGYSQKEHFPTENSEQLLKRVILASSKPNDIIMDFFLGSGTTTAVAHKLRRRWIGVEVGDHFYTVILPRMKRVLAYDKSGISKDDDVKQLYNKNVAGGFFKYYELEQFEDALEETLRNETTTRELHTVIDMIETLSNITGKWIKKISADYAEYESGEVIRV